MGSTLWALLLIMAGLAICPPAGAQPPHMSMSVLDLVRTGPTAKPPQPEALNTRKPVLGAPKPRTIRKTWTLTWKSLNPDGALFRPIICINGKFPGPTVVGNAGDRLIVKVINNLNQSASVHWHGFYQNGTNSMDGIPGVTQYSIFPGETFLYNFTLEIPGTYWYHSHWKTQYIDGLYGALVVLDSTHQDYNYANNVIMMAGSYWNLSSVLVDQFLSPSNVDGDEPVPDSCLINGVGQVNCTGNKCKYAQVTVGHSKPCDCTNLTACRALGGSTRLINSAGFATIDIAIDDHLMWIVAADSVQIQPTLPVGSLRLNTGQRYDVVLCRANNSVNPKTGVMSTAPAWIRVSMDQSTFPSDSPNPDVRGVLRYINGTRGPPTTKAWSREEIIRLDAKAALGGNNPAVIDPFKLVPLEFPVPPPSTVTIKLEIEIVADPVWNNSVRAHFNNMSQVDLATLKVPLLVLAQQGKPYPVSTTTQPGPNVVSINYNDVVDVIINNKDGGEHPIHLHGQNFWVMGRGPGLWTKFENITHTSRDTATVAGDGHLALRFTARNRGVWLMHCHIDWHMAAGLGMIWSVGMDNKWSLTRVWTNHLHQPPGPTTLINRLDQPPVPTANQSRTINSRKGLSV